MGLPRAWKGAWDLAHPWPDPSGGAWDLAHPQPDPSGGAQALLQPPPQPLLSDRHQVTGCCYERPSLGAPCLVEPQPRGSSHMMWTGGRAPEQGWEGVPGPPAASVGTGERAACSAVSWELTRGWHVRQRPVSRESPRDAGPLGWEDRELSLAGTEHSGSPGGPDAAADEVLRRYQWLNVVVSIVLT